MPLYRALRDDEIDAGNILIPKSQAPFRAHPRLPIVFPFTLGEQEEHAVREHQWSGQHPTRGISCTTEWLIALHYAIQSRVIVTISEALCDCYAIRRYRVRDHIPLQLIVHPEDEEVILVSDIDGPLPSELVTDVTQI